MGARDFMPFQQRSSSARTASNFRSYVFHKTASATLSLRQTGSTFTNQGASGSVTLTLPQNAEKGTRFTFTVLAAQSFVIDAGAAGAIYYGGSKGSDDGQVSANSLGATITLECDGSNDWYPTASYGTWTAA